jgi:hypothetical protein
MLQKLCDFFQMLTNQGWKIMWRVILGLKSKTKNKRCCFAFKNKKTISQYLPPQSLELVLLPTPNTRRIFLIYD